MSRIALVLWLGWRLLLADRIKYGALLAGLSFAAFLVTVQASVYAGFFSRSTVWIRERPLADLWVIDPTDWVALTGPPLRASNRIGDRAF